MQAKWVSKIFDAASTRGAAGGYDGAEGIDFFANICRHEEQHRLLSIGWWGPNGSGADNGTTKNVDPTNGETDNDGDYIPDSLEAFLGSFYHADIGGYDNLFARTPDLPDDVHYGSGFNDNEDYTRHTQQLWTKGDADKYDWSDLGHQY